MERLRAELRDALAGAEIPLELLTGGEIAFNMLPELDDEPCAASASAGTPRYLLLELPDLGWPLGLEETCVRAPPPGLHAVLAHPERSLEVQRSPETLERLVEKGSSCR